MCIYIGKNVIRGNFSMNNPQPLVGLCNKDYDITDLFDESEHLDISYLKPVRHHVVITHNHKAIVDEVFVSFNDRRGS